MDVRLVVDAAPDDLDTGLSPATPIGSASR
jgi:hypothetical protein